MTEGPKECLRAAECHTSGLWNFFLNFYPFALLQHTCPLKISFYICFTMYFLCIFFRYKLLFKFVSICTSLAYFSVKNFFLNLYPFALFLAHFSVKNFFLNSAHFSVKKIVLSDFFFAIYFFQHICPLKTSF